jgi:hypothetical protein
MVSRTPNNVRGAEAVGAVLLGGIRMTAATQDAGGSSIGPTVGRVLSLLQQALQMLDEMGDCPELGARLQEVIDALEERSGS